MESVVSDFESTHPGFDYGAVGPAASPPQPQIQTPVVGPLADEPDLSDSDDDDPRYQGDNWAVDLDLDNEVLDTLVLSFVLSVELLLSPLFP